MVWGAEIAGTGLREVVAFVPADESFQRWTLEPALASFARDVSPAGLDESDPRTAANRVREISDILARRPLSSINWLRLARAQLADERPPETVERSFVMSVLTGPDEGYVMAQRGLVGISLWELLPPDVRRHVAADITGTFIPLTEAEKNEYKKALAAKSGAVRNEIRDALVAARLFPAALARIGL
jgi:hypothetical protein